MTLMYYFFLLLTRLLLIRRPTPRVYFLAKTPEILSLTKPRVKRRHDLQLRRNGRFSQMPFRTPSPSATFFLASPRCPSLPVIQLLASTTAVRIAPCQLVLDEAIAIGSSSFGGHWLATLNAMDWLGQNHPIQCLLYR